MKKIINNVLKDLILTQGSSRNLEGKKANSGYMVGGFAPAKELNLNNYSLIETKEQIEGFIEENKSLLKEGSNFLGCWIHKNELFLDISKRFRNSLDAKKAAKELEQLAIYNVALNEEIFL